MEVRELCEDSGDMVDVFHIGYPKSAGTWLRKIFNDHPGIEAIPSRESLHSIIFEDDNVFSPSDFVTRTASKSRGLVSVYATDGLSGWGLHYNYARIARRMAAAYPNARVLIIVREQVSFLESLYRHELLFGYGFSPEKFLSSYCPRQNVLHGLSYDAVLTEYKRLFEHVHVELMERLTSKEVGRDALCRLLSFIGVEPISNFGQRPLNIGMTGLAAGLTRGVNRFSGTKLQQFDQLAVYNRWRYSLSRIVSRVSKSTGVGKKFNFEEDMRAQIRRAFAGSNDRLSQMLDIDLAGWGYSSRRSGGEENIGERHLLDKWFDPLRESGAP